MLGGKLRGHVKMKSEKKKQSVGQSRRDKSRLIVTTLLLLIPDKFIMRDRCWRERVGKTCQLTYTGSGENWQLRGEDSVIPLSFMCAPFLSGVE